MRRTMLPSAAVVITLVIAATLAGTVFAQAETTVSVPGNQPWTDTGLDLATGSSITITADGTIKIAASDPGKTPDGDQNCIPSQHTEPWAADFIAPDLHCWALIGRIGDTAPFEVGTSTTLWVPTAGRLYLGVNDGRADFGDNSGAWTAHITVNPVPTSTEQCKKGGWKDFKDALGNPLFKNKRDCLSHVQPQG
jgi:hypothetical protein